MRTSILLDSLQRFPRELAALVEGVSHDFLRWKPAPEQWSILEIVCHLADEEAEDFGVRLQITLAGSGEPWPAIAPDKWPQERHYQNKTLEAELQRFQQKREQWLAWLRGVDDAAWRVINEHPKFGSMRAGDLLLAWAAHDQLHMKQIVKRKYQWLCENGGPYRADYAGSWTL